MLPLSRMEPSATIVRFAAPPAGFVMFALAFCTMLPVPVPALAVVIVTLVPAFSALLIVVLLTVALAFEPPLKPPVTLPL